MKISNFIKTMSTAVQIQLTSTAGIFCRTIVIQASSANTSYVCVGGSSMTSGIGVQLVAGDSKVFNSENERLQFHQIYAEGSNGDTIRIETIHGA